VLHLSEHAAYGRIAAARVARRVPSVVDALRLGDITLTTVCLVAPHLTPANSADLLAAVRHKSKRDVEQFVAALAPKPDIPARVRKVPARATTGKVAPVRAAIPATPQTAESGTDAQPTLSLVPGCADAALSAATARAPARPATIAPLAPERYKIQFTASRELHDKLRRAQDLLRHTIPDADVAAVIDRALTLLVEELERRKLGATTRPRPPQSLASESRYIPAAVKRSVWSRDEGRCTFVGTEGRCTERGFLEFHHLVPFAAGGETSAANLALRCRAHNQFEAGQYYGPLFVREMRGGYGMDGDLVRTESIAVALRGEERPITWLGCGRRKIPQRRPAP
jgi:hypothetical protein